LRLISGELPVAAAERELESVTSVASCSPTYGRKSDGWRLSKHVLDTLYWGVQQMIQKATADPERCDDAPDDAIN
jgi:hypothetical protein